MQLQDTMKDDALYMMYVSIKFSRIQEAATSL